MPTLPNALFDNWRLKASALGLAVFLWALVQTEPRSEESFSAVPVQVAIADTSWTLASPPAPATVELRLDGPTREIIRLAREGTVLRIPIPDVASSDTAVVVRREWVELGQRNGLVVQSVSPAVVRLAFEPAVTRLVPVSTRITGRLRENLAFATDIGVNPPLVRVRGPESRVAGLDSIPLLPFDLGRITGSGIYTVSVDTSNLGGGRVVPPTATLGVRVEDVIERVLEGLIVEAEVGPGQEQVVVEPMAVRLTLSGARTVVTSFDTGALRVWVPREFIADMEPGEERRVRLLVDGVPELVTAVPGTDYVTVRRAVDLTGGDGAPTGP